MKRGRQKKHILDKTNDFKRVATKRTGITLLSFLLSTRSISSSFTFRSILSKNIEVSCFSRIRQEGRKKIASNRSLVSIEGKNTVMKKAVAANQPQPYSEFQTRSYFSEEKERKASLSKGKKYGALNLEKSPPAKFD